MRLRVAAALLALPVASAVVTVGACSSSLVHTWGAFVFDPAGECLHHAQLIDVIEGPDPGSCAAVHCWVNSKHETLITDRACDAPLDVSKGSADACAKALKAYADMVFCVETDAGAGGS